MLKMQTMCVLSPQKSPFQVFCSQIKVKVTIGELASYQGEPCGPVRKLILSLNFIKVSITIHMKTIEGDYKIIVGDYILNHGRPLTTRFQGELSFYQKGLLKL